MSILSDMASRYERGKKIDRILIALVVIAFIFLFVTLFVDSQKEQEVIDTPVEEQVHETSESN
jgi:Mn2+/Fe2+ NRAMP family transporter